MLFKTGNTVLSLAGFHKWRALGCRLFKREFVVLQKYIWPIYKPPKLALANFQKLTVQLQEICYPRGAKDLKSFQQTQKLLVLNG
jgi:hypothetical protein